MKKYVILIISVFFIIPIGRADEGMWLPFLLKLNEKDMQSKGLKISAEDIYSINQGSLKDAIVLFGGGCTGEIVSDEGLLLTNHHCGYGRIQAHSSLEHDYLTHGFWAMNKEEELSNPGFTVTMLVSMRDVTDDVLKYVSDQMDEAARNKKIEEAIRKITVDAVEGTHYKAVVKPVYNGNQYILFINEVFEDIRLVGTPPSNIGKFGGDTDNWMWPRHTGDFSVFRIYVGKDGKPAPYSKDNVPYKPKKHLTISLKGVEPEDFTFVFGYPGTTQQFLTSWAVELIQNQTNPVAIDLRTKRLDVIKKYMDQDRLIRIQYSAKAAGIANGWKKWIGENRGLKRLHTVEQKKMLETEFTQWLDQDATRKQLYGNVLAKYEDLYKKLTPISKENTYFMEAFYSIELVRFIFPMISSLDNLSDVKDINTFAEAQVGRIQSFFKDYNINVDKEIFVLLMQAYLDNADKSRLPNAFVELLNKYSVDRLAEEIYSKSVFAQQEKLTALLEKGDAKSLSLLKKDMLYRLVSPMYAYYFSDVSPQMKEIDVQIKQLDRLWTKALMEMQPEKTFYPDANLTLRVAYGKVDGYNPIDGVNYKHITTVDGIMEKENPDIYDYVVEAKLKELYEKKDYGRYATADGKMPVAFVATNHTTGGNSGSPILNGNGHLIGINFDRCWEGTMSDIHYDPDQCRNISVDIRYVLFIIDKFAGAKHLIDEMKISAE
ncbi:MAG: S46 family peptidase [Bacteroidales bacterium]|jgi:hypothetical protein|nr:S46 family peptidase [Bacteroidales bacterium]